MNSVIISAAAALVAQNTSPLYIKNTKNGEITVTAINRQFMSTMTKTNFDNEICVECPVEEAKSFFEYIHAVDKQSDFCPAKYCGYYDLAVYFGMEKLQIELFDIIKTMDWYECINALYMRKDNVSKKIMDLFDATILQSVVSIKNGGLFRQKCVDKLTLQTLLKLLSTEQYLLSNRSLDLESCLLSILLEYFTINHVIPTEESRKLFNECLGHVHLDAVSADMLFIITSNVHYDKNVHGLVIFEQLNNRNNNVPMRRQRHILHCEALAKEKLASDKAKCMKTCDVATKKVGDYLEASDYLGKWYTAVITEVYTPKTEQSAETKNSTQPVSEGTIRVHFGGWNKSFDEVISIDSGRFANLGTFTCGIYSDQPRMVATVPSLAKWLDKILKDNDCLPPFGFPTTFETTKAPQAATAAPSVIPATTQAAPTTTTPATTQAAPTQEAPTTTTTPTAGSSWFGLF